MKSNYFCAAIGGKKCVIEKVLEAMLRTKHLFADESMAEEFDIIDIESGFSVLYYFHSKTLTDNAIKTWNQLMHLANEFELTCWYRFNEEVDKDQFVHPKSSFFDKRILHVKTLFDIDCFVKQNEKEFLLFS